MNPNSPKVSFSFWGKWKMYIDTIFFFHCGKMTKTLFDVCFPLIFTFPKCAHQRVYTHGYLILSLLFSHSLCDVSFIFNTVRAGGNTDGNSAMALL